MIFRVDIVGKTLNSSLPGLNGTILHLNRYTDRRGKPMVYPKKSVEVLRPNKRCRGSYVFSSFKFVPLNAAVGRFYFTHYMNVTFVLLPDFYEEFIFSQDEYL